MPTPFRIASFNVENLFSRAKVLNLNDHARATELLNKIERLKSLLLKPTYTPEIKQAINTLLADLKDYVLIREDRGKLLTRGKVSAPGAAAWDGVIELKRASIKELARQATADVLKALAADVACVIETENRPSLQQFNRELMGTRKFPRILVVDGNDARGIDVGLLAKLDVGRIDTHIFDEDDDGVIFSRDCLEVELLHLPNGKPLYILCNHLKSMGYGPPAQSDEKRRRQAARIAQILTRKYDLTRDHVVVAGDLNNDPSAPPLRPLLSVPHLYDVLQLQFGDDPARRWTYRYKKQNSQLDYLLVSQPLRAAFTAAGVERRGIWGIKDLTGETGFKSVTAKTNAASDHGAVWAEFSL